MIYFLLALIILTTTSYGQSLDCESVFKCPTEAAHEISINSNMSHIFVGESHFRKQNPKVYYAFVRELVKNGKIDGVLLEDGYCTGYLVNEYLAGGDYSLNGLICSKSKKELKKLKKLYSEIEGKPNFIGVDYERNANSCLRAITVLSKSIKSNSCPEFLTKLISKGYDELYTTMASDLVNKLDNDHDLKQSIYRKFFDDKYAIFIRMLESYKSYVEFNNIDFNNCEDSVKVVSRENYIFENIKRLFTENVGKRYFGQFGSVHTIALDGVDNYLDYCMKQWDSFVSKLIISGENITSVQLLYDNDIHYDDYVSIFSGNSSYVDSIFSKEKRGCFLIDSNCDNGTPIADKYFRYALFLK